MAKLVLVLSPCTRSSVLLKSPESCRPRGTLCSLVAQFNRRFWQLIFSVISVDYPQNFTLPPSRNHFHIKYLFVRIGVTKQNIEQFLSSKPLLFEKKSQFYTNFQQFNDKQLEKRGVRDQRNEPPSQNRLQNKKRQIKMFNAMYF